ncbi:MAG: iron export ABC transporter permease subunit FetB [Desulfovibrio sp.]|nr:MAG: iron export ABC transporter permease subunit FetB [Desulfovibrio sp.]
MNPEVIPISMVDLVISLVFILAAGLVSVLHKLSLHKDLLIGTARTFIQLLIMGYALTFVFELDSVLLVMGVYVVMIVFGAQIIHGRVKEREVNYLGPTFLSMLAGYFLIAYVVTGVVVGSDPWWKPQYFVPLAGMVIGNSMSALAISLERLFTDLRAKLREVEMRLSLGADYAEASHEIMADALKAGMIPSINSMMGVGLVFIPGMTAGQVLAGSDPLMAVRYQIVVMLMMVASTALSTVVVLRLVRRRCFGPSHRLLLSPSK